jgi:hypothetical protein
MTGDELDRLLAWFHTDRDEAAEAYEIMRLRLIAFFDRRGCQSSDELADEAFDRVAKRLVGGEAIRSGGYFLAVAHRVYLEMRSRPGLDPMPDEGLLEAVDHSNPEQLLEEAEEAAARTRRTAGMIRCLRELGADDRRLVLDYHRQGARGARAGLALQRGLTMAGLYTRLHRLGRRLTERLDELLGPPEVR